MCGQASAQLLPRSSLRILRATLHWVASPAAASRRELRSTSALRALHYRVLLRPAIVMLLCSMLLMLTAAWHTHPTPLSLSGFLLSLSVHNYFDLLSQLGRYLRRTVAPTAQGLYSSSQSAPTRCKHPHHAPWTGYSKLHSHVPPMPAMAPYLYQSVSTLSSIWRSAKSCLVLVDAFLI